MSTLKVDAAKVWGRTARVSSRRCGPVACTRRYRGLGAGGGTVASQHVLTCVPRARWLGRWRVPRVVLSRVRARSPEAT